MREVNYIFYMTLLYMLSSLYRVLKKGKIYILFDIEKLMKYDFLIIIAVGLGVIFLLVNYYRNTNQVLKTIIFKIILPIVMLLLGLNYPNFGFDGVIYAMVVYLIVAYIFMYPVIFCKNREEENDNNNLELYPSRKNLVDVLNHALRDYSLIALDGTWGSGKTTFMDIFMRENSEKFYYIPINVMLFENRNSLKTEFLNQLKVIFKEEGIFQGSLMDFDYYLDGISNDWVKVIKNIIFSNSKSFKEANEKLKSEIGKVEKRIVVGVDNLERIYGESEPEWKQILGFINELQEIGIKIVVMADLEKMLIQEKKEEKMKLVLNSREDSEIKFFQNVEIQKIEQEENNNYDYFDKFYEFKLQLNEVTTEEIIDELEIKENTVDKEWLKKQIKELTEKIENAIKQDLGKSKAEKTKINKDLFRRYLDGVKNPRKIEKLIKDIQVKKIKEENIFNFIENQKYEVLIFKTSLYKLIFFDYMIEHNKNLVILGNLGENLSVAKVLKNPFSKNIVFQAFGYEDFEDERVVNRLLYYSSEDKTLKDKIETLDDNIKINLNNIGKYVEDLEIYSSSLDPDFEQKTTKEAYKIIEEKLVELEKTDKDKIHKIIEENEENICKLNYITYPDKLGIHEKINYKFKIESKYEEKGLLNQYSDLLKLLDDVINSSFSIRNRSEFFRELVVFRNTILIFSELTKQPNLSSKEISELYRRYSEEFTIDDIQKLKNIIKSRGKSNYIKVELEEKIFERLLNLLEIIKINLTRSTETKKSNKILERLEKYNEEKDENKKVKFLDKILWQIREEKKVLSSKELQGINGSLNQIMESEANFKLLLELNKLKEKCEIRIFPKQIKEKSEEILNIDINNDKEKFERIKKELIDFINGKVKEVRWQYIFDDLWNEDLEKLKEIGIEVDKEKYLVKEESFIKI